MSKINSIALAVVLCISLNTGRFNGFAKDSDPASEEVVAAHLKSIGSPEVLAAIKSRAFVGTSSVNLIQGMQGNMTGNSMFVSDGNKLAIVMKFGDINYPGEYFAYDGKDVSVGYMSPGQRSPIADFLFRYNGLMKEGLIGGELSGSWPLLDLKDRNVELKYHKAKIDGRRLYEIEYIPKDSLRNVKIKMYFDPKTYHHVRTEYRVRIRDDMSAAPGYVHRDGVPDTPNFVLRDGLPESIYSLVEKFDDFQKTGKLTLPHSYTIDYSVEGQGHTFIANWTLKANQWIFDKAYNEQIFQAQK